MYFALSRIRSYRFRRTSVFCVQILILSFLVCLFLCVSPVFLARVRLCVYVCGLFSFLCVDFSFVLLLQFAASVLERRLNEVLRFTLGRTYGVTVHDSFASAPPLIKPSQELPGTVMVNKK